LSEIELIETLTSDYMNRYGYEKMTDAQTTILPVMFEEAEQKSVLLRQAAWEKLALENTFDYKLRSFRKNYLNNLHVGLTPS
jgi:hypothetical protein